MPRQSQLVLFAAPAKNKKRTAPEFAKHCVVADFIRLFLHKDWKWTHLPMGEFRTPATAGRLQRMGVQSGWPDLMFVSRSGQFLFVELKRDREIGNPAQEEIRRWLEGGGVPYLISSNVDTILTWLKRWGVLRPEARW